MATIQTKITLRMKLKLYLQMVVAALCSLLFASCDREIIIGDYDHQIRFEKDAYHFSASGGVQEVVCITTTTGYVNYTIIEAPDWIEIRDRSYDEFCPVEEWITKHQNLSANFEMRCLPNTTGATRNATMIIHAQNDYIQSPDDDDKPKGYEPLYFQGTITITQDAD